MAKRFTSLGVLALSALFNVHLVSCNFDPTGSVLSGTVDVGDFSVAAGQTKVVSGDLKISASGSVDIAGSLVADGDNGQSITIQAEGDVNISGTVTAGNGSAGAAGGDLTIVSMNGDITLTESSLIAAGDGGGGQTTIMDMSTAQPDQGSAILTRIFFASWVRPALASISA